MTNINIEELKRPKANRSIEIRLIGVLVKIGMPTDIKVQEIMSYLDLDCFYFNEARTMFMVIKQCLDKQHNFDYLTLESIIPTELLMFYMEAYQDKYCSLSHIDQDIKDLLLLKALRKQLPIVVDALVNCSQESLPIACHEILTQCIHDLSLNYSGQNIHKIEQYSEIIDRILSNDIAAESMIKTSLLTLPPIPKDQMITIAGRSGAGKTYWALFLMDRIAREEPEKQTLYFNLEMKPETLVHRHARLLTESTIASDWELVDQAAYKLLQYHFNVVTNPYITIEDIETIARVESMKRPISVLVVDYIGLVKTKQKYTAKEKHLEQGNIAQRLASLASSLNCIVICLLQVNRDHKTRGIGDKCPYPTDSAESMGCERSSALWLGVDQPQIDSEESRYKDLFVIKNRKSREGTGLFTVFMEFKEGRFFELNQEAAKMRYDNVISDVSEFNRAKY